MKASEFDKKFDQGTEDVVDDLDLTQAKRISKLRSGLHRRPGSNSSSDVHRDRHKAIFAILAQGEADIAAEAGHDLDEVLADIDEMLDRSWPSDRLRSHQYRATRDR